MGSIPEIAQYGPNYLSLNFFTASKGSGFYILFSRINCSAMIRKWRNQKENPTPKTEVEKPKLTVRNLD